MIHLETTILIYNHLSIRHITFRSTLKSNKTKHNITKTVSRFSLYGHFDGRSRESNS